MKLPHLKYGPPQWIANTCTSVFPPWASQRKTSCGRVTSILLAVAWKICAKFCDFGEVGEEEALSLPWWSSSVAEATDCWLCWHANIHQPNDPNALDLKHLEIESKQNMAWLQTEFEQRLQQTRVQDLHGRGWASKRTCYEHFLSLCRNWSFDHPSRKRLVFRLCLLQRVCNDCKIDYSTMDLKLEEHGRNTVDCWQSSLRVLDAIRQSTRKSKLVSKDLVIII